MNIYLKEFKAKCKKFDILELLKQTNKFMSMWFVHIGNTKIRLLQRMETTFCRKLRRVKTLIQQGGKVGCRNHILSQAVSNSEILEFRSNDIDNRYIPEEVMFKCEIR